MALVSLSSDIEERREAALAELSRLKTEIEQASDFGPSDAHLLHDRCKEILGAFQRLADKMLLAPDDVHRRLTELELELRQSCERGDALQLKLDEEQKRTGKAVVEASRLASDRFVELSALRQKAAKNAETAKLTIADLKRQLVHWRKVASGEVLSFKPGPRKAQPGKPYRKPPKSPGGRSGRAKSSR